MNGPNGTAGLRPKSSVRNAAEARLSRAETIVWLNLIDSFDRYAEEIAGAALGADVARLGGVFFDLAAKAHDLDVDRAVVDLVVVQPRKVEQLVACQDALRRAEQHDEQAELAVRERDRFTAGVGEAARVQVQLPAVEAIRADAVGPALAHFGAAAAQHGADAREELARAEGLGEVVVGAELEAHYAVGFFRAPGEHDDRNRRFVAQRARERHAVFGSEPEVQHDQVDHLLGDHLAHRAAVRDRG